MRASDAKYKIYLDERAIITNGNFLIDLLKVFQNDKTVGAVGTSGAIELSTHGVSLMSAKRTVKNFSREVEILDGFFFATQYDLPWRADLFADNFFGGEAQCVEFRRAGYKLFVIGDWISFDTSDLKFDETSRQKFLNEYSTDLFPLVSVIIPTFNRQHRSRNKRRFNQRRDRNADSRLPCPRQAHKVFSEQRLHFARQLELFARLQQPRR